MSIVVIDSGGEIMRPGDAAFALRNGPTKNPAETIRKLRKKLENYHRRRARCAGWIRRFVPTSLTALDTALPHGGLPCGAITENISSGKGVGAMALAMRIASRCIGHERHQAGRRQPTNRKTVEVSSLSTRSGISIRRQQASTESRSIGSSSSAQKTKRTRCGRWASRCDVRALRPWSPL